MNRLEIVYRIDDLHDIHCKPCLAKRGQKEVYNMLRDTCRKTCPIGLELQRLGKELDKTIGKRKVVMEYKDYRSLTERLPKETYIKLRLQGKSRMKIREDAGLHSYEFYELMDKYEIGSAEEEKEMLKRMS